MTTRILGPGTARCRFCSGSLAVESDEFGTYIHCLMCGRSRDLGTGKGEPIRAPDEQAPAEQATAAA